MNGLEGKGRGKRKKENGEEEKAKQKQIILNGSIRSPVDWKFSSWGDCGGKQWKGGCFGVIHNRHQPKRSLAAGIYIRMHNYARFARPACTALSFSRSSELVPGTSGHFADIQPQPLQISQSQYFLRICTRVSCIRSHLAAGARGTFFA